ncbi:MAG: antitoxin family protein [Elusimicrobia bacterium]|nr:antitoxin family protein [Elusimicrobiota bacterium]
MTQLINAVYQHGILKPLDPLRLSEKEKVYLMVTPMAEWKKELGAVLRNVHKRTSRFSSREVESDITRALRSVRQKTK